MRRPCFEEKAKVRRGFGLVEVALSCLLLALALSLTVTGLSRMASERKAIDRRVRATAEVSNTLERFLRLPWSERTSARGKSMTLSDSALRRLPGATLVIDVADDAGSPPGRRVAVEVRWATRPGEVSTEAPVRLVAWTYPTGDDAK
jgi:type II secretory pathway component PulJ